MKKIEKISKFMFIINLIKGIIIKIFEKVLKKIKIDIEEDWYTSGTQEWKGKIPYLIIKLRITVTSKIREKLL